MESLFNVDKMKKLLILLAFLIFQSSIVFSQSGWFLSLHADTIGFMRSMKFIDSNTGLIVGGYIGKNVILKTTNGGINWLRQEIEYTGLPLSDIAFINKDTIFVCGGSSFFKTTNGGANWTSTNLSNYFSGPLIRLSFPSRDTGYILIESGGTFSDVIKTTNGGISWISTHAFPTPIATNYTIDFINNLTGFVGRSTNNFRSLWRTTNGGSNWYAITSVPQYSYPTFGIKFIDEFYGMISAIGTLKTSNGGVDWYLMGPRFNDISLLDREICYYTGGTGLNNNIYKTTNGGDDWITLQMPSFMQNYEGFYASIYFTHPDTGFVSYIINSTNPASLIILKTTTGGVVGVNTISFSVPEKYYLYQNYPNPFNPSTTIKFDLVKASNVELSVFDITGKFIGNLVNEKLNAGSYEYSWNAEELPSGVYFYRLTAEDFSSVKRMILLK
jgi:photosystem II stability/assembly factor-like uncharacterized protein